MPIAVAPITRWIRTCAATPRGGVHASGADACASGWSGAARIARSAPAGLYAPAQRGLAANA